MKEIRKLFGANGGGNSLEGALEDGEANLESFANGENDQNIANAKLIDQILKLKLLINEQRRALEGADLDDDSGVMQKEDLEKLEAERAEN